MASRGVNKVILVGNVGQDPEVRYMPSGGAVTNLSIATSEQWKDKNTGEAKEKTEWHRVVIFGKLAEIAGEYVRKGSQIYIEGSLQTKKYTDQAGVEKYSTEVVVAMNGVMQMLGGKPQQGGSQGQGGGQQNGGWGQPQQPTRSGPPAGQQANQQQSWPSGGQSTGQNPPMDFDDDIPF